MFKQNAKIKNRDHEIRKSEIELCCEDTKIFPMQIVNFIKQLR